MIELLVDIELSFKKTSKRECSSFLSLPPSSLLLFSFPCLTRVFSGSPSVPLHSVLPHSAGLLIFGSVNTLGCFRHSPPPLELPWVMFLVGCLASFLGFTHYRPVVTTKNISLLPVSSLGVEK